MSGFNANVLLQGVANASPWLSSDELLAPRKQAVSEQRNALLNAMDQQTLAATDQEMVARASAYLNTLDEDKRAAAYPGIVAQLQQSGFAKNAPSIYPGHERIAQLASMGTPSKELLEQAGVQRDYQAYLQRRAAGGASTGIGVAPGAATTGVAAPAAPGVIEPDAQARAFAVRDGLIRRGMDPETATAFAANALHESSANPNTGPGDRGASHGLFQWRDDRAARYQQLYGHSPDNAPLDEQLDFVMHELSGPESLAKGRIAAAQGAADKAAEVSAAYLRPKDVQAEMQRRRATAQQLAGSLPNVTPGMGDQAWLDQMTRQYPSLGGPNANPNQPVTAPYQTASLAPVPPPTRGSGGVVAGGDGSGAPAAPAAPAAVPGGQGLVRNPDGTVGTPNAGGLGGAAPPSATTAAPPAATLAAPAVPPPPPRQANGLTAAQNNTLRELELVRPRNRAEFDALQQKIATTEQTYRDHNETQDHQYQQDLQTAADRTERQRLAQEAAKLAQKTQGVPTGYQRTESGAIEPIPGFKGTTESDRADYDLKHADPSSQEYADAWKAKKWQITQNGSVIEQDMSGYPAPTRSIQRPTFLPQPTGTALDEVRKADTDARVITSAIDHYTDVHKAQAGASWDAYIANPRSKEAQQLLGAFDRLKTVLRSPVYYNTGVLQPAEMQLLKEDLVSPQTLRGLFSTPEALASRLHEIKVAVLTRQDAELRSVGKDGVIVRDKSDFAKIPEGGKFYDEDGNLRIKPRAQ